MIKAPEHHPLLPEDQVRIPQRNSFGLPANNLLSAALGAVTPTKENTLRYFILTRQWTTRSNGQGIKPWSTNPKRHFSTNTHGGLQTQLKRLQTV